ncbi:CapA family protein [Lutimonas vermicola]|uniref:CapA family protein n=1 Tax=Lutimonas vermicola TaxID=414288 RepID=A0ABU9L713_9FLAO
MSDIIIAGDLAPLSKNQPLFEIGEVSSILNNLEIHSDFFVANLECPLTSSNKKQLKSGPNIKASLKTINGIKNIGISLVNLANNHILDFGEEGYNDTLTALEKNEIDYFGSGSSLNEANTIFVKKIAGLKIGFYGVSEFEWSIVSNSKSGANPIDKIGFLEAKEKTEFDHLIVFIHGGKEHYNLPTPNLQKLARFYADYGASVVICQHTHIIGCQETYKNIPIFYGQGNFIFNYGNNKTKDWNSGFLINLNLAKNKIDWKLIFFNQLPEGGVIKMCEDEEKEYMELFNVRSKLILSEAKVKEKWIIECAREGWKYERQLGGINKRIFNLLNKLKLDRFIFQPNKTKSQLSMLRCETHREVIETWLSSKIKEFEI